MAHEQSETIERNGQWVNIYGRKTPKAGQPLPGKSTFASKEEALAAARMRSMIEGTSPAQAQERVLRDPRGPSAPRGPLIRYRST